MPESFLFQTIIDVDDKEYVEKAIEKARELNCSSGIWNGSLLHLCYSARKKLHIGIRMPIGMTIEETQKAYCEALGVPYDGRPARPTDGSRRCPCPHRSDSEARCRAPLSGERTGPPPETMPGAERPGPRQGRLLWCNRSAMRR